MLRVAVILGSTRPGRNGEAVAKWVYDVAKKRTDAEFEYVDIKDYELPLLDEPIPPSLGKYSKDHTKTWAAKIDSFDAFVFVTAEYNHGIPASAQERYRLSVQRVEQQGCRICWIWQCRRRALCRTTASGDGRTAGCNRTCAGAAFSLYRLREL